MTSTLYTHLASMASFSLCPSSPTSQALSNPSSPTPQNPSTGLSSLQSKTRIWTRQYPIFSHSLGHSYWKLQLERCWSGWCAGSGMSLATACFPQKCYCFLLGRVSRAAAPSAYILPWVNADAYHIGYTSSTSLLLSPSSSRTMKPLTFSKWCLSSTLSTYPCPSRM